jgi:hypothetical protein
MSSKPQRNSNSSSDSSERELLPFELSKSRKQADKKAEMKAKKATVASSAKTSPAKAEQPKRNSPASNGIPDAVSRRMVKRMAVFSGIPTALGMSTFIISYFIVSRGIYDLPTYAVLLVSLGFFGLGVAGLSYGAISASWDEETLGSPLGWSEFTTNLGRMTGAWKESREEARNTAKKS